MGLKGILNRLYTKKGLASLGSLVVLSSFYFPVLAFTVSILFVTHQLYLARKQYGVLESCGIPVVPPTWFCGSEPNLHDTIGHFIDVERFKQFGGIWGSYVGQTPHVFITDPELIRRIFVKDFNHFMERQFIDSKVTLMDKLLGFQEGERWKFLRTNLNPLFTTAKLKQLSDVISENCSELMRDLKSECGSAPSLKFDCKRRFATSVLDVMMQIALGNRMIDRKNPDNAFVEAFRVMHGDYGKYNKLYSLSFSFPILRLFASSYKAGPTDVIADTCKQGFKIREKTGAQNSTDALDVLFDMWTRLPTKEFKDLGIDEADVISQAGNFFVGGFDTTTTTLTHILYNMAKYPEIQDKMYSELWEALNRNETKQINHEFISDTNIPYISAVINETLRLTPPLYRPDRMCNETWSYSKSGSEQSKYSKLKILKGTVVVLPTWAANRNPQCFPDQPTEFKPERMLPENKANLNSYAFASFGFGPRICFGMRLTYEILKIYTCHLVKNFKIEVRSDTKLVYKPGVTIVILLSEPVYVNLVPRK